MKVGICIEPFEGSYFSNGVRFNAILWYDFFKNCGYDVSFLSTKGKQEAVIDENNYKYYHELYKKYHIENFTKIWEDNNASLKLKEDFKELYPELFDYDVIFLVGLLHRPFFDIIQSVSKTKLILIDLGSTYHNDMNAIIYNKEKNIKLYNIYDEIWISPHFKFSKQYLKFRYNNDNIYTCPYLWREDLMTITNINEDIERFVDTINNEDTSHLKVGIVEPNLEISKNFMAPLIICNKAHKLLEKVYVCNAERFKNYTLFNNLASCTELYKDKKLLIEGRHPFPFLLAKYFNCVVSYVKDCDLNYIFLECFFCGVPLVHNSPLLKDYGYYYPDLNIDKGVQQLEYIIKNHNREEYKKKHLPLIQKYSVNNQVYIEWAKGRLEGKINYDCE